MQCERRKRTQSRRERGVAMLFSIFMVMVLLGFAALAIDVGVLLNGRSQLQHAADAAAHAALQELRDSGNLAQARHEASRYARANTVFGRPVQLGADDVEIGFYDYRTRRFTPGFGFGAPAMRVTADGSQGSPTGPMRLFFAPVVGKASVDVSASAVASIRRRDLCIVQDRTFSFVTAFPFALDADRDLVEQMEDQGLPGDRICIVSFARDTIDERGMTELTPSGVNDVLRAINSISVCTTSGTPECFGTDIGAGIDAALQIFRNQSAGGDAERVMVIVTDGTPCLAQAGTSTSDWIRRGKAAAAAAADRAGAAGISIFPVTLDQGGGAGCFAVDTAFNESLARGFGRGFTTTSAADLDDILLSILTEMPVYLVE